MKTCPRCHVILSTVKDTVQGHMALHIEQDLSKAMWDATRYQDEFGIKKVEFKHSLRYSIEYR